MAKRKQRLPGQFQASFRVDVAQPGIERGDDGRTQREWFESGEMMATTTYLGDLERMDGRWSLAMQWIDSENQAHKYFLPHEVVKSLKGALDRIMDQAVSERATKAAATRRDRGIVPFKKAETA
jgi:hypothetical protein